MEWRRPLTQIGITNEGNEVILVAVESGVTFFIYCNVFDDNKKSYYYIWKDWEGNDGLVFVGGEKDEQLDIEDVKQYIADYGLEDRKTHLKLN